MKHLSTVSVIARIQTDRKLIKTHLHNLGGWREKKRVYHLTDHLSPDTHRCKQGGEDKPRPT